MVCIISILILIKEFSGIRVRFQSQVLTRNPGIYSVMEPSYKNNLVYLEGL